MPLWPHLLLCFASLDTSIIFLLQVYVIYCSWNVLIDIHIMLLHGLYSNITSSVRSPWSFNLTSLLHHLLILLSCFIFPHCSHLQLNMFSCSVVYCCISSPPPPAPCIYHQLTTPSLIKTCSRRPGPLSVLFTTTYLRVKVSVWHMIRPSIHIYGMSKFFSIQNQTLF